MHSILLTTQVCVERFPWNWNMFICKFLTKSSWVENSDKILSLTVSRKFENFSLLDKLYFPADIKCIQVRSRTENPGFISRSGHFFSRFVKLQLLRFLYQLQWLRWKKNKVSNILNWYIINLVINTQNTNKHDSRLLTSMSSSHEQIIYE